MRCTHRWVTAFACAAPLAALVVTGCDDQQTAAVDPAEDGAVIDRGVAHDAGGVDAGRAVDVDAAPDATPADTDPPVEADASGADAVADAALDPLTVPLAPYNAFGAVSRINQLYMPNSPDDARRAGCLVHGASAGSALANLLALAGGGLDSQVRANGRGDVDLVFLLRAVGWAPGVSAGALEVFDLDTIPGAQDAERAFLYRMDGFVDGDLDRPVSRFAETRVDAGGWLDTDVASLYLPLSLLNSPELPVRVDGARITGRVAADTVGWRIDDGVLTGYITRESIGGLIVDLRRVCTAEGAPSFCNLVRGALEDGDDALLEQVEGIIGGFDARLEGGFGLPCDPEVEGDCNAIGLCMQTRSEGVEVVGTAPAPPAPEGDAPEAP